MKERYIPYYERISPVAAFRFLLDSLFASPRRRLALRNRQNDYAWLTQHPEMLPLHLAINRLLLSGIAQVDSYDYGEGYFYQSMDMVGVSGFRDTRARIEAMDLLRHIENKNVLEIGCNAGFLAASIAPSAGSVVGFDIMPHLIEIGSCIQQHLQLENTELLTCSFEEFETNRQFDVVLSFANHSTFDGQTRHTVAQFFAKCSDLCAPGGQLLFESHPPELEGEGLEGVVATISEYFEIQHRSVLEYGGFLDRNRTFLVGRKRD